MKTLTMLKTALGLAPGCEKVNEFLAEYVDGELDEKTRQQFEDHIGMCGCCNHYLDQYKSTISLTKETKEISVPSELAEHTLSFLRKNANFPGS